MLFFVSRMLLALKSPVMLAFYIPRMGPNLLPLYLYDAILQKK